MLWHLLFFYYSNILDLTLPSSTNKTWFYNHVDEIFIDGPRLNTARFFHAAGLLLDSVTQGSLLKGIDNILEQVASFVYMSRGFL